MRAARAPDPLPPSLPSSCDKAVAFLLAQSLRQRHEEEEEDVAKRREEQVRKKAAAKRKEDQVRKKDAEERKEWTGSTHRRCVEFTIAAELPVSDAEFRAWREWRASLKASGASSSGSRTTRRRRKKKKKKKKKRVRW